MADKLIIDRSRWYRGCNKGSALRRAEDGKMCCLGFDLLRRGFTVEQITGVGVPEEVNWTVDRKDQHCERLEGLVHLSDEDCYDDGELRPTETCEDLVSINDDESITDAEREAQLVDLFAEIGVEVQFVDGEPDAR